MTDVLILHRIPGHREGAIVTMDEDNRTRLERAVRAGNAEVLPAERSEWSGEPAPAQPEVLRLVGTGTAADQPAIDLADALEDEDTDTEGEDD